MEINTVKVILAFERGWGVPRRYEDIPNRYVKVYKEKHLDMYLWIPQDMATPEKELQQLGKKDKTTPELRLNKSLYGLKQAGRLRSQLLHNKPQEAVFTRALSLCDCITSTRKWK